MPSSEFYSMFEHTADIGVEVKDKTLEGAIEKLLLAFYDLNVEIEGIEPIIEKELEVSGENIEDRVVYLLEEALFLFETEGFIGKEAKVKLKDDRIIASVKGEYFDPGRHTPKFEIKAITYHQLNIKMEGGKFHIRVVFDV